MLFNYNAKTNGIFGKLYNQMTFGTTYNIKPITF